MPSITRAITKAIPELVEAVGREAVPALERRGTAAAPTVLERLSGKINSHIGQRGTDTPFLGDPETKHLARATEIEPGWTIDSVVQNVKKTLGSLFMAEPAMPKDVRRKAFNARWRRLAAQDNIDLYLKQVFSPLQRDKINQLNTVGDFMFFADEVANASQKTKVTPSNIPLESAQASLAKYTERMAADPEMQQAHKNLREALDTTFDDMVARGLILPERKRASYTPVLLLEDIAEGLAKMRGIESIGGKTFRATLARGSKHGYRETNILELTRRYMGEYARKAAEDDFVIDLINDPTLNFTAKFKPGDIIPEGLAVYRPGPGMPGYGNKNVDASFYEGFVDGIDSSSKGGQRLVKLQERIEAALKAGDDKTAKKLTRKATKLARKTRQQNYVGGIVMPSDVVDMLTDFTPMPGSNWAYTAGQFWSRQMTVYNPRNTVMNMLSDFPLALMGMQGEKANPLGVLRFAPEAYKEAFKGAFGKESALFDAARQEGLTSGTMLHDVGGQPGSLDFSDFQTSESKPPIQDRLADVMRRSRLAVEAAPRMAAGMAANGGEIPPRLLTLDEVYNNVNLNEFGRVGREITLPYGAGAPKATRYAATRFIAPFLQFIGLASARTFEMVTTPGSRTRSIAGLIAPGAGAMMWNNQNEEYSKVEKGLKEWERNQLHFVVPDPDNPTKPYRDRTGKPVVWRFQYWVPEQVANTFGFGNLPSRVKRIVDGRETWQELPANIGEQALANAGRQIGPVRAAIEIAEGKDRFTGEDKSLGEAVWSATPVTRTVAEAILGFRNEGMAEGGKRLAQELAGFGVASLERKGKAVLDADLMDAKRNVQSAVAEFRRHKLRRDEARAQDAKVKLREAQEQLRQITKARANEKDSANEQPE